MAVRSMLPRNACFCLALLADAFAGTDPALQQTVRVTTRLVEVSVVAETKNGDPVSDLTQQDFTILDQGRPETIAVFTCEKAEEGEPTSRPLPPNVFSNRLERLGKAPTSATVVLFDGLNTELTDQAYARQQIVKFLEQLEPGDQVALYVLGRGPRVLQDFTSDSNSLLKALESYKGEQTRSLEAPMYDPALTSAAQLDSWLGELTFNLYDYFERDRAFRTVRSLVAIANHLERLPGRRNLVWVSGSFPVWIGGDSVPRPRKAKPGKVSVPEFDRAARALNRANLAVYPVDARGLMAPQEYRADRAAPRKESRIADVVMFNAMRVMAERTGGRAFYNNNDLRAAVRRAADDARLTYLVGYYPSHDQWNGKFREIKLQVNRPDVQLHYRRGYFALSDEPVEPWYRQEVLEAATWSPVEATGLGLTVRATAAGGGMMELELQVDANDIALRQKDGAWTCGLDLWFVQFDRKEKRLKTEGRTNNLRLDRRTYEHVMKARGLVLMDHVKPDPKAFLLRVLARDIVSGALGSLTIPLRAAR